MSDIQQDRAKVTGNVADMARAASDYLNHDHPFQGAELLQSYATLIKNAAKNNEPLTAKAAGDELTAQKLGTVLTRDSAGNPTKIAINGEANDSGKPQTVTLDLVNGTVDGMSKDRIDKGWTAERHVDAIRDDAARYRQGRNASGGGDLIDQTKAMMKDGSAAEVAKMLGSEAQFHLGKHGALQSITLNDEARKPIQLDVVHGKVDGMDKDALAMKDTERYFANGIIRKAVDGSRSYSNGETNLLARMANLPSGVSAHDFATAVLEDMNEKGATVKYSGQIPTGLHLRTDR